MKGKAKTTLKNTKIGEGKLAHIDIRGMEPHIKVAEKISKSPLFLGLIVLSPFIQIIDNSALAKTEENLPTISNLSTKLPQKIALGTIS